MLVGTTSLGLGPPAIPTQQAQHLANTVTTTTNAVDMMSIKIEALTLMVASLSEIVKLQIQSQQVGAEPQSTEATVTGTNAPEGSVCNFYSLPSHFI